MFNFDCLEKDMGIVSPPNLENEMVLMFYSIN